MEVLIEHFKNLDCEYQIATSNGVVCSSANFEEIKKSKLVAINMYSYNDNYYDKTNQIFEVNGIVYAVSAYINVTKYAKEIMKSKLDCLTRLPNRQQLQEYLNQIDKECIVVMCDIDDFKKVNDTYGHQVGDDAIKLLGDLIRKYIGENDFAGRYGGEEFLIIFDSSNVSEIKEKMDNFNSVLTHCTRLIKLSASIGIHKYDPSCENVNEAIKKADEALYYVKHNGKNNTMIYENMKNNERKKS